MSDNPRYKSRANSESRTHRRKSSASINGLLAYYQSPSPATPESPVGSASSSDSLDSDVGTKKRSTEPSQGGADRRRVAIVQIEALQDAMNASSTNSSASSIRSRRGLSPNLAGLALVAPPDASSKTYTQLTPPPSVAQHSQSQGHQPSSVSEHAARDLGAETHKARYPTTVTPVLQRSSSPSTRSANTKQSQCAMLSSMSFTGPSAYSAPLINTPAIGASKDIDIPVAAPVVVDLASRNAIQPRLRSNTSAMEASPSTKPFDPIQTSGFVHYQPGLDATAGPLPPPPRLFDVSLRTPPPPRPPRLNSPAPPPMRPDLEAVKQALQLPASVTAKLAKTSKAVNVPPVNNDPSKREDTAPPPNTIDHDRGNASAILTSTPSLHRREGAFPASPFMLKLEPDLPPSTKSPDNVDGDSTTQLPCDNDDDDVPTVTIERANPPISSETIEEQDEDEGIASSLSSSLSKFSDGKGSSSQEACSFRGRTSSSESIRRVAQLNSSSPKSHTRSNSLSPRSSTAPPSPPPKSFRHSLTSGLKRLSTLPRTPSSATSNRASSGTHQSSSRTPSPSVPIRRVRRKIIDYNPPAMFCHEVYQQRTTAERCALYVTKINELYACDCGLSDWVVEMKYRAFNHPPRGPSAQPFSPKPRQTSRSSMISEATFPRRPDASLATDLSSQVSSGPDASPISVPAALPYQSLANQQRQQSVRSISSAASGTSSSIRSLAPSATLSTKTGFFASLGRKASLTASSRRERGGLSLNPAASNAHRNVLTKHPHTTKDISRPILIASNHSVPSGPRALTSSVRVQRSQTLMTPMSPTRPIDRDAVLGRRPSLFKIADDDVTDMQPDPEFVAQVDKLHNLLPHADRAVLAGYLHRAGQDVLAIGQYLEDEKNGTLKFF